MNYSYPTLLWEGHAPPQKMTWLSTYALHSLYKLWVNYEPKRNPNIDFPSILSNIVSIYIPNTDWKISPSILEVPTWYGWMPSLTRYVWINVNDERITSTLKTWMMYTKYPRKELRHIAFEDVHQAMVDMSLQFYNPQPTPKGCTGYYREFETYQNIFTRWND